MDKRGTEDGTYHFKVGDAGLGQSIVDAVAYVTGVDPMDLEPLYHLVDADALNSLFDQGMDGRVSFEMEGVEVTVTGSDEIIIEDLRETVTLHDRLDGASTVLLLAPTAADETCIELLSAEPSNYENVLSVTFAQSAYERLEVLDTQMTADPARGTIISMGEFTRSTATASGGGPPMSPFAIETVEDPTDLSALGIRISDALSTRADTDGQTVACIHSLTDLLALVDEETARGFLDVLTDKFEAAGAIAHYHLDPTAHDEQTVAELRSRFDAVVEVDDSGEQTVQIH